MKIKWMIWLLLGCFLIACGTLKSQKEQNTQQLVRENKRDIQQLEVQQRSHKLIINDTLHQELQVEILPKGKFTFSNEKGFEGEATSLYLRKKTEATTATQIKEDYTGLKALSRTEAHKTKSSSKKLIVEKEQYGFYWKYFGLAIALLVLGFAFWRLSVFLGYSRKST